MEFFSPLLSFIIVIGILVFVHELGHFLTAKWTGMRADVFALGMGPRLFGWNRLTGFSFGKLPADLDLGTDTDYRISALPIGGYVRILGMIDESFDTDFANEEAKPWEFRSKNAWQKTLVLIAGVAMNLLLAVGIFWAIPLIYGQEDIATTEIGWVAPNSVSSRAGLQQGDIVVSVDGEPMETWSQLSIALGLDRQTGSRVITVNRQGVKVQTSMEGREIVKSLAGGDGLGITPKGYSIELGAVISYDPADKGGMKAGDKILAMDSTPVAAIPQLQSYIRTHAGKPVVFHVERGERTLPCTVVVGPDSTVGVELAMSYQGPRRSVSFNPFEALTMAVSEVTRTVNLIGASVVHVFRGDVGVRQSFGGPIRIAQMASQSQELGLESFLRFMALISISLAVMNLLPLPGLDGGHLVFVIIEAVIRREVPTQVKIRFQQVGVAILLALMVFIFYLDLT